MATSDAHRLRFFGEHYSLLGLEKATEPPALNEVFDAIRAQRIKRVSPTGGLPRFLALMIFLFLIHPVLTRLPGSKRAQARRRLAATQGQKPAAGHRATA